MRQFRDRGSMWRRSVRMHFADRYGLLPRRVHIGPKREVWGLWAHMESRGSSLARKLTDSWVDSQMIIARHRLHKRL
jgi:hypothetical protein